MADASLLSRIAPAPRRIGARLLLQTMIGGLGSQMGWLLLGFGSIFFWGFAAQADLSGWRFAPGAVATATGESLGYMRTSLTEGRGRYNTNRIYRNLYRFQLDGASFEGASYAKGIGVGGGPVTVEYLIQHPEISRIAGMRRRPLGPAALMITVIPGIGLALIVGGLVKGRWRVHLLREGMIAPGSLVDKKVLASSTMGHPDVVITFEFTAQNGGIGRTNVRTNSPELLKQDGQVPLLYDETKLSKALPFRSFPGRLVLDREGQPVPGSTPAFLFLPCATLLGNGLYVYLHWA
jgi:hypothetical protein